jgi:hypothetical protein
MNGAAAAVGVVHPELLQIACTACSLQLEHVPHSVITSQYVINFFSRNAVINTSELRKKEYAVNLCFNI